MATRPAMAGRSTGGPVHKTTTEWLAELQAFLREKFRTFISDDYLDFFVNDEAMKVWKEVFTHISKSPDNYERYETVGDAVLKDVFYDYIHTALPWVTRSNTYSELQKFYNSKPFFNSLCRKEGYPRFLRKASDIPLMDSLCEDLFEAINGGLKELGNKIGMENPDKLGIPIGYNIVMNYQTLLMNEIEIDPDLVFGSFQSQFGEMETKLRIKDQIRNIVNSKNREYRVEIYYYIKRSDFVNLLKKLGIDFKEVENFPNEYRLSLREKRTLKGPEAEKNLVLAGAFAQRSIQEDSIDYLLLGQGIAGEKSYAESQASRASLRYLSDTYGITRELAQKYNQETHIENSELAKLMATVREYYPEFRVQNVEYPPRNQTLHILIGKPKDGKAVNITHILTNSKQAYKATQMELFTKAVETLKSRNA